MCMVCENSSDFALMLYKHGYTCTQSFLLYLYRIKNNSKILAIVKCWQMVDKSKIEITFQKTQRNEDREEKRSREGRAGRHRACPLHGPQSRPVVNDYF